MNYVIIELCVPTERYPVTGHRSPVMGQCRQYFCHDGSDNLLCLYPDRTVVDCHSIFHVWDRLSYTQTFVLLWEPLKKKDAYTHGSVNNDWKPVSIDRVHRMTMPVDSPEVVTSPPPQEFRVLPRPVTHRYTYTVYINYTWFQTFLKICYYHSDWHSQGEFL